MENIEQYKDGVFLPKVDVRYELRVYADDQEIYGTEVGSEEALLENLRKVDVALSHFASEKLDEIESLYEDLR